MLSVSVDKSNWQDGSFFIRILGNQKTIIPKTIFSGADTTFAIPYIAATVYELSIENNNLLYDKIMFLSDTISSGSHLYKKIAPKITSLSEVIVKKNSPYYKGDTLVIPVDSIKTRPHAGAAELLNKVPGIDIGASGDVKVNGKKVDEITINGQRLFGGNARATLESIKGDMVQQLEITERENSSGEKIPSLNLRLRKSKSKGWYGDATILGANAPRHKTDIRLNYIKPQFYFNSFLNHNNINEKSLSEQSLFAFTNSFKKEITAYSITEQQGQGSVSINRSDENVFESYFNQYGISKSFSGGASMSKSGKKNNTDAFLLIEKNNRVLLQDYFSTLFIAPLTQKDSSFTIENTKRFNLLANISFHSFAKRANTFKFAQTIRISSDDVSRATNIQSKLSQSDTTVLQNLVTGFSQPYTRKLSLINQAMWLHRYKKTAMIFSAYGKYEFEKTNFSHVYSNIGLGNNDQSVKRIGNRHAGELQLVQSIPINRKVLFEARINNRYDVWTANQAAYNYEIATGTYSTFLPLMSAAPLRITNFRTQASGSLLFKRYKTTLIAGIGVFYWESARYYNNTRLSIQHKPLLLPFLLYKTKLTATKALVLQYKPGWDVPANDQLTPLPDSANIQQVRAGNPLLNGTFRHTFSAALTSSAKAGNVISASIQMIYANKSVISQSSTSMQGKVSSSFVQYGNTKQVNASLFWLNFNAGKPFTAFGSLFASAASSYAIHNAVVFDFTSILSSFYFGSRWKMSKKTESEIKWQVNYNNYISNENSRSDLRSSLILTLENSFPHEWYTTADADIQFNGNNTPGKKVNFLLRIDIAKYFSKNNRCRLTAGVRNILDVNNSAIFTQTATLQSVTRYNILPRLFSLGFTCFFDKWSGKD